MQVHGADAVVSDSALYGDDPEPLQTGQALDIEFKNVCFYYDKPGVPAVNTINLKVAAGTTLAIVGGSGAGKSTLVHLLLRFRDPQHGTINVGGHDIQQMRLAHLRQNVALVAQDTYLFNDTLKENLLMARPGSTDAEVMVAIQRAQLSEFVRSLPQGLDTTVGERGYALSGGQRQRVSIARAFLRDAPVLILDEATSHLDALSEQAVHQALGELMQSRTTVVIAHRLATIRDADNIVVMQEGAIVETGTHTQLLIKNSAYSQLLRYQMTRGHSHAA
jgi:ATP-binding cassette subfamily C protein CydCD